MFIRIITLVAALAVTVPAADLTISGQSNKTYDGGTYDKLNISNSSNITVRNCSFKTPSGTGAPAVIGSGCTYITLDNCDIDGNKDACKLIGMTGASNVTIKNCFIHNANDDGIETHQGTELLFEDNVIADLWGCGTDGGCGPCYNGHSDGFEFANVQGCILRRNFIYNIYSTSCFFLGNWSEDAKNNQNFLLENNIFYPHHAGYVLYLHNINGVKLYGNTFWKGSLGGLALGANVQNFIARNNIFHNINTALAGITLNPVNHDIDYNMVGLANQGVGLQPHDIMAPNPVFARAPNVISSVQLTDPEPDDFKLNEVSYGIGKGTSGGEIPTTDFFGTARTVPYDMGAIETSTGVSSVNDMDNLYAALTKVVIGPNPCYGTANITLNRSGVRPDMVVISAVDGSVVWKQATAGQRALSWDTSNVPGGMYRVQMMYHNRVVEKELMVVK